MKKMIAGMAAMAAVSMLCTSVSAANWAKSYGYKDIEISTNESSATFRARFGTLEGPYKSFKINMEDVIANPADATQVKRLKWKVTVNGLSDLTGHRVYSVGATGSLQKNEGRSIYSEGVTFYSSGSYYNEDFFEVYEWEDQEGEYDSISFARPMDLSGDVTLDFGVSGEAFLANDLTVTISELQIFDVDGNEIAQKPYDPNSTPPEIVTTQPEEGDVIEDTEDSEDTTQTEPPATEPTETEPPATEPTQTEPPATEPTETEPPVTEPTQTEPPVTQPTVTEPPVTQPPQTQPTVTLPTLPPAPPVSANTDIWGPGNRDYDEIQLWARYGGGTVAPRNNDNAETERIDAGAGMAGTAVSSPDGILAAAATAFAAALAVYTKKRRK